MADNMADGDASAAEWRTPPLWSLGLSAAVSGGEAYLHDGRARTIAEANQMIEKLKEELAEAKRGVPFKEKD